MDNLDTECGNNMSENKVPTQRRRGAPEKLTFAMQKYLMNLIRPPANKPQKAMTEKEMYRLLIEKFLPIEIEEVSNSRPKATKEWIEQEAKHRMPGPSRVNKFIGKHRDVIIPEDGKWSLGMVNSCNIPPDIIPVIIEMNKHLIEGAEKTTRQQYEKLAAAYGASLEEVEKASKQAMVVSSRQAKWIAYLYPSLKRIAQSRNDNSDIFDLPTTSKAQGKVLYWLMELAMVYAHADELCEALQRPFDSFKIDYDVLYTQRFFNMNSKEKFAYVTRLLFD